MRGRSPVDFESTSLTTRTYCQLLSFMMSLILLQLSTDACIMQPLTINKNQLAENGTLIWTPCEILDYLRSKVKLILKAQDKMFLKSLGEVSVLVVLVI